MISETQIFNELYKKYSKLFLNKKEVSVELGISEATLNRRLKAMEALPIYEQDKGKYAFSIINVARFVFATRLSARF